MKHWFTAMACVLVLLGAAFAVAGCRPSLDMSTIDVGPGNSVPWADARTIIERRDQAAAIRIQ